MQETNEHLYFINQLYRDFILPDILGQDTVPILYWAGKHLAQKYKVTTLDDLTDFFQMAGFGHLVLTKKTKTTYLFTLDGQIVADRIDSGCQEFTLESGLISACLQTFLGKNTESRVTILDKAHRVEIKAQFS